MGQKMHLGPASKHIPHTCTKPKHTTHAEATILVLSSMLKTSIQQLVSLSKHTFHWNGIFFHQKTKLMNFVLTLSYMTEAVKLKKSKQLVSFTPTKYHNCSGAKVKLSQRGLNCPTRVLQQFSNQVKSPRSSFGHIQYPQVSIQHILPYGFSIFDTAKIETHIGSSIPSIIHRTQLTMIHTSL